MPKLCTDINFFPNETLIKLEDGQELSIIPTWPDGTRMNLDEFREAFMLPMQGEIYINYCEGEDYDALQD